MNIIWQTLKTNIKGFIIWSAVLSFFTFMAMFEYSTMNEGLNEFMDIFPRIVLIVLGANPDINIGTAIGLYCMVNFYFVICLVFYSVSQGNKAVSGEIVDKTHEFLFTKPISRNRVLALKMATGAISICALNIALLIASILAFAVFAKIELSLLFFFFSNLFVSLFFFSLSCFFNSLIAKAERASQISLLIFLTIFILSIVYDIMGSGWYIKVLTPLRYFEPKELADSKLNIFYLFLLPMIIATLSFFSFKQFRRKELR